MAKRTRILAIGFVLLWNSGFIGAEFGLPYTGPFTLLFLRYGALTLVLAVYLVWRRRLYWHGLYAFSIASIVGILAHGVWLMCVLLALDYDVPAGIVALVVALQPMATGAFAGVVTGEQVSLRHWLGLIIGFTGVALPVIAHMDFSETSSITGYLIPFGAPAAMTAANLIQRRLEVRQAASRLPIDLALFYQSLATTLVFVLPAVFAERLVVQWTPVFISTMLWLVLAVSLSAYALMWMLLARIEATSVASLFYLGPPVTMFMAWIALGDTIQPIDIAGLAVVAVAVMLTQHAAKRQSAAQKSPPK